MNVLENLKSLVNYYMSSKGVGHTYTLLKGIENDDRQLAVMGITGLMVSKNIIKKENIIPTSFETFQNDLQGMHIPLVIDNSALLKILLLSIGEIESLQEKIENVKAAVEGK